MRQLQSAVVPHNPMSMILPAQLRAARSLIGWSREALAKASAVPAPTIRDFELGATDAKQGTVHKWRRALETAGVEFIEQTDDKGPGVRLKDRVEADGATVADKGLGVRLRGSRGKR